MTMRCERMRARKRRSDKPFALMARDIASVETLLRGDAGGTQLAAEPAAADCDSANGERTA